MLAVAVLIASAMPAAADFAITNVNLIDGNGGRARPGMTIVVKGDRITAVGPTADVQVPDGAARIDGAGKFLIPGLMDMHIHLIGAGQPRAIPNPPGVPIDKVSGLEYLHSYLYDGVTSVYDAGNNPGLIMEMRADERAGKIVSPRIFASGWALSYPGSWMADSMKGIGVAEWDEAVKAMDKQIAAKPDLQKFTMERFGVGPSPLGPTFPLELIQKMLAYMHDHGVRTVMHVTTESLARDASAAGLDAYAHPVASARMSEEFLQTLVKKQSPVATTLAVYDDLIKGQEESDYLEDPFTLEVVPRDEIEERKKAPPTPFGAFDRTTWFKLLNPYLRENIKRLHDAGGVVVLATDRSEGPMLHRELALLAEIGIPPADIIRIGTLNGAKFLGREKDLGTLDVGKLADMVLLKADPTADVRNARQIDTVIKGGAIIDRTKLQVQINRDK